MAALVAALALAGCGGGDDGGGGGGGEGGGGGDAGAGAEAQTSTLGFPPETAPAAEERKADEGGGEESDGSALAGAVVAMVQGPPSDVAAFLESRGYDARVADGRVIVRGADPADVDRALTGRPRGSVEVLVQ